ncbi:MAG: amino acid ABC transporter ATP-binding protein [Actinomycetota bacterium]
MTNGTMLRVNGLVKKFGDRTVLNGIDLDVSSHQVVCLIGASGSGKSTLLRCLNALEVPDGGSIEFLGVDLANDDVRGELVRRHVGMVFQAFNLFPHRSVLDNVTLGPRRVLGQPKAQAVTAALQLLERFGLLEKAKEYPDRLSGGQQQRVAIVRALAMEPRVLLLDEITSALDPELVGEVLDVVRELASTGMTMVLATHEMEFARDVATSVVFLAEGKIVEAGPPEQLLQDPKDERTKVFLRRYLEGAG